MIVPARDEFLLARCLKRERTAIEELVAEHARPIYGFFQSALGEKVTLAQPIFVGSFIHLLRKNAHRNLKEPIRVILLRFIIQRIQEKLNFKNAGAPLNNLDFRLSILFESLSRLPWDERILLLFRDQMDLSLEEIGAILSKSQNEIRSRLKDCRLNFRKQLENSMNNKRAGHE